MRLVVLWSSVTCRIWVGTLGPSEEGQHVLTEAYNMVPEMIAAGSLTRRNTALSPVLPRVGIITAPGDEILDIQGEAFKAWSLG